MFRVLAEHLAPAPIQADGQRGPTLCTRACCSCCTPAGDAASLLLREKHLLSVDSAEENQEFACLLGWEPTAQKVVELVGGAGGRGNCAVSAPHDEHRWFLFSLDNFVRIQGANGSWRRRGASKTPQP